jgi:EAL domain-containing protein (putative c-di-GMP-specific phosphodiesterase class I)
VLVTAMEQLADMDQLASKLVAQLSQPYVGLDGHSLQLSPSIGIAFFPRDGHDVATLCQHADMAMYASKRAGRGRATYYDTQLNPADDRGWQLERELAQAIAGEQLVLHFQPKVRLEDCRIEGFEALVRWQHPAFGLIYPGEFIALAEKNGLIAELGDWVIRACCQQAAAWRQQGLDTVPIAVNVSALQLRDTAFPTRMATYLQQYGVRASDLELEITESCLVEPVDLAVRVLNQLEGMGMRIGLDDFGTGFSSLSQIRHLPIDTIKLDRSFVDDIRSSPEAGVLVTSIITLAHNLKMRVVAEGVELRDQLVYLKTAGCDAAQGYILSRPCRRRRRSAAAPGHSGAGVNAGTPSLRRLRPMGAGTGVPLHALTVPSLSSAATAHPGHRSAHTASRPGPGAHRARAGPGRAAVFVGHQAVAVELQPLQHARLERAHHQRALPVRTIAAAADPGQSGRCNRRHPVVQRLLHAVLAGDAGADLAAAVVLAIGDHRPAVVLAGLDAVDFVAALGTVLVHPQLAVGGQHRALRAAVAPAPDGRQGVGAGNEGVVGDAAVLAHAHDLAQVAAQVLCLFLVLGAFAQRQEQAAVRLAVHHALHDAAAKVQGAVVLGLLLENHLHLLQGGGGVQRGTGQGGAVLAGIRAGAGLAVAEVQLAVLGKAAVQHHVQQAPWPRATTGGTPASGRFSRPSLCTTRMRPGRSVTR